MEMTWRTVGIAGAFVTMALGLAAVTRADSDEEHEEHEAHEELEEHEAHESLDGDDKHGDHGDLETDEDEETHTWFRHPEAAPQEDEEAESNRCLDCHAGLAMIRGSDSGMMQAIFERAAATGTGNRCVVCHGGDPSVGWRGPTDPEDSAFQAATRAAHSGTPSYFETHPGPKRFYPDPGSPWVNADTCGVCHAWEVEAQWRSLMMTEAGKIQGTAWGFGALEGYRHEWANYSVANPSDPAAMKGTEVFQAYLDTLAEREPQVFVDRMTEVPPAPNASEVATDPSRAAFTYIRGECQRCHLGVRGKQRYGDYRGMGCSACHIPYANDGRYRGKDRSIDSSESGHLLVHTIQATPDAPVTFDGMSWSGIPVETCTTCHNRGRRIGVSFQGLMETPYASPWSADGDPQHKLHGKHYLKLKQDLHGEEGFVCQDCHTSLDVHSPNRLIGAISAAVEVECTDCHGTPDRFPWELPLGYGDEYAEHPAEGRPRGVASTVTDYQARGWIPPAGDGYLLSARGNPLGNVVRHGQQVWVYLASGELKKLDPLKRMLEEGHLSTEARVAMVQVDSHMSRMECYACHATWAPQCYGCHVEVDYREAEAHTDWVALGKQHRPDGTTVDHPGAGGGEVPRIPGRIRESRSYLRWEDPSLGVNGEGRIAPVIPGCQTTVTVIDGEGKARVANHIYRIPNVEGAGPEGQLAIDHSPLHPHTVQEHARPCVSCHGDEKAAGYGIGGGRFFDDPSEEHEVELATGDGHPIASGGKPLVAAVEGLEADWSRFVTPDGTQIQTVGHHFTLSRPLNDHERALLDRRGVCLSCHQEIPSESVAVNLLHHAAEALGAEPETDEAHSSLLRKILLLSGWVQVAGAPALLLLAGGFTWRRIRRRRAAQ